MGQSVQYEPKHEQSPDRQHRSPDACNCCVKANPAPTIVANAKAISLNRRVTVTFLMGILLRRKGRIDPTRLPE